MLEQSFFMIKPDGVARGIEDQIFSRVKSAGIKVPQKFRRLLSRAEAEELYSVHKEQPFYGGLLNFITSGPVVCCLAEGEEAVGRLRAVMGATDPRKAEPGTIRGDLKEENVLNHEGIIKNMVHGSDSPASARREIGLFFKEGDEK